MTEAGFRLDIQGVRGLALVLVLGCHAGLPFMEGGFVGLDVFYVLSGFLITGLILDEVRRTGRVSLLRFYARRARRLLPLAATVLLVTLAGSLLLFSSVRSYEVSGDVIAAALYVANWRFIAENVDYFEFDAPSVSPVQHYWSLSVEEQFYLAWPILILGVLWVGRRSGWSPRALLWAVVGSVSLASVAYAVWFSSADPYKAYFSSLTRIWEIGLGCALALALPLVIRLPRAVSAALAAAGLATLAWGTIALHAGVPYPGWHALVPTLGTAAIIVAGTAVAASGPIRLLSVAPLQYLGKISYAWYLWHWPVLAFAAAAFGRLTLLQNVVFTLLAWVPTIVTHHLIEERFRRSRSLARRPRRAVAMGLACTVTAVGLGISLAAVQPVVPTASGEVLGARAVLEHGQKHQGRAEAVRPNPREVSKDREPPYEDGCHLRNVPRTDPPECVYGDPSASKSVVNLGDSHGLMYSAPVIELGREKGWRVVNLTRGACTIADVEFEPGCDEWREKALQRIEEERPDVVTVSTGTGERYEVVEDGERLSRDASQPLLEDGLERTLSRLRETGAKVVVIRDIPPAPDGTIECVAENIDSLGKCSFAPERDEALAHDARAARRVEGAELIDPLPVICPDDRCGAVIGDALVYRNNYHLTPTFTKTLAPWLERKLGPLR